MKIRQVRMSTACFRWKESFLRKYGLKLYHDRHAPALFFGCYKHNWKDQRTVVEHCGPTVIVWRGFDVESLRHKGLRKRWRKVFERREVYHVAISESIASCLRIVGIPYVYLPVCPVDLDSYKPTPLGDKVYVCNSRTRSKLFGSPLIECVRQRLPGVEFIVAYDSPPGHYLKEQMLEIYSQCFLGLRLTSFDGLSNTVVELGLMGRRCVWNGQLPSVISWQGPDDIVKTVREEREKVGSINLQLAQEVKSSLELPEDWLTVRFYERLLPSKVSIQGVRARRLRKILDLSQTAFAERLGCSAGLVRDWEKGFEGKKRLPRSLELIYQNYIDANWWSSQ